MANKLINSTNIKVFPTAYRNDYDPGAKFYSEENIGNILNSIIDNSSIEHKEGFVAGKATTIADGSSLTFNLHGYWFRMKFNYSDFSNFSGNKVIAYIEITTDETSDTDNKHLRHATLKNLNEPSSDNLDSDGSTPSTSLFGGVKFFDSYQTSANENYQLLIAEKVSSNWIVPSQSVLKLSTLDILDKSNSTPNSTESTPKNIRDTFTTKTLNATDILVDDDGSITFDNLEITKDIKIGPSQPEPFAAAKFNISQTQYGAVGAYNQSLRNIYINATTSGAGNEFAYLQDLGSVGFTLDYVVSDEYSGIEDYLDGNSSIEATKLFEVKWNSTNNSADVDVYGNFTTSGNTTVDGNLLLNRHTYSLTPEYFNPVTQSVASLEHHIEYDEVVYNKLIVKDINGNQLGNIIEITDVNHAVNADNTPLTNSQWGHIKLTSSNNYTYTARPTVDRRSENVYGLDTYCTMYIEYGGNRWNVGLLVSPAESTSSTNYSAWSMPFRLPDRHYYMVKVKKVFKQQQQQQQYQWCMLEMYLVRCSTTTQTYISGVLTDVEVLDYNINDTPAALSNYSIYWKEVA